MKFCFSLYLFFLSFLFAQNNYDFDKINHEMNAVPFVFEGYVIQLIPYMGDFNGKICEAENVRFINDNYENLNGEKLYSYFSIQMQVCKIYKGKKLREGTI